VLSTVALSLCLMAATAHADEASVPEPDGYRTDDYRKPVPKTLTGARVIDADEADTLLKGGEAVFIDVFPRAPKPPNLPEGTVWRDPTHMTIGGAHWLPNIGYGLLSADFETYFKSRLATLTGGDLAKPVVFFCLKDCWMSWNAGKRALTWGYTNVIWFSEGTDAWQQAGFDLVKATPVP
jgi:PQQ-dependent catabolism-associated CXXCW motif protein